MAPSGVRELAVCSCEGACAALWAASGASRGGEEGVAAAAAAMS